MAEPELDRLIPLVYAELRRLAAHYLRGERPGHTLQTTELVHEAYVRLRDQQADFHNPGQVLGIAARQMRRILVDHARARGRLKRSGAGVLIEATEWGQSGVDVLALDQALEELAALDARQTAIVEMSTRGRRRLSRCGISAG
jgi:RNA polymerase sigma factor (TIGR02999 family)